MTIHYHRPIDIDDVFVSKISTFLHAILYVSRDFTTKKSGNWILNVQWTISIFSRKPASLHLVNLFTDSQTFSFFSLRFFCSCIFNRHEWVLIYYTLRLQSHNLHSWLLWIFIFFLLSFSFASYKFTLQASCRKHSWYYIYVNQEMKIYHDFFFCFVLESNEGERSFNFDLMQLEWKFLCLWLEK